MKTNLIYHVAPLSGAREAWQWNIRQLVKRWDVFTGEKFIAITTGEGCVNPRSVVSLFPADTHFITMPNDTKLREAVSFYDLLDRVRTANEDEITFYAHTKGLAHIGGNEDLSKAITLWTAAMYHYLLDDMDTIFEALDKCACVGCFRRLGQFITLPSWNTWHYSGTFFWFRNDKLFSLKYREPQISRYTPEAYLSYFFPVEESACILGEDVGSMYNFDYVRELVKEDNPLWLDA